MGKLAERRLIYTPRVYKFSSMDPPPAEGVLAQPTRARIFDLIVSRRSALDTETVAAEVGLHPNGVRRHLERLEAAGLLVRTRLRGGQGRPRDAWAVAPGAAPGGERPRGYADLARWLVRAIPPGRGRLREVERTGREIGRELAPAAAGDPVGAFVGTVAALGFQPALERSADGFSCRLENCPYRDSVHESAEVVCTLHRGITAGILAELDPDASLVAFEPHDPDRAGCLVEVSGGSAAE